jgi:hypothetical protein
LVPSPPSLFRLARHLPEPFFKRIDDLAFRRLLSAIGFWYRVGDGVVMLKFGSDLISELSIACNSCACFWKQQPQGKLE